MTLRKHGTWRLRVILLLCLLLLLLSLLFLVVAIIGIVGVSKGRESKQEGYLRHLGKRLGEY